MDVLVKLYWLLSLAAHGDTIRPELFAPGPLPVDTLRNAAPAFSPDGNTVYFHEGQGDNTWVLMSKKRSGRWMTPAIAPFSGTYRDLEPAYSPDGKYLVFSSSRPGAGGPPGEQIDGWYNGKVWKGRGGRLWKVTRDGEGWGVPEMLPVYINSDSSVFSPNIARNGDLYFMRADSGSVFHLYCSRMRNGQYQAPERLSFSKTTYGDFDPAIASDESFVLFSSRRPPAPNVTDLFIVYRTAGEWGEPIDLRKFGEALYGIEARLSPDNKTLYFSNSRNAAGENVPGKLYIWKADLP